MPGFGITPIGGFPPPAPEDFPRGIEWQENGVARGDRSVDVVNVTGGLRATRGTGETANVLTITGTSGVTWREVAGDTTLAATDAGNGIVTTGGTGEQVIIVPGDEIEIEIGQMVLIYSDGAAAVSVEAATGVLLRVRDGLSTQLAGQFGTVTLIKRAENEWIICGDLAAE